MFWVKSALIWLVLCASVLYAQTPGTFVANQVLTAAQLNAALALKADFAGVSFSGAPTVGQQLVATSPTTATWQATRIKLTGPLTLFASFASGADVAGCGLAGGASACKTLQFLYNSVLVPNYDTAGRVVTLSFDSTDTTGLNIQTQWSGGGQVNVQGPGGTCTSQTVGIATAGNAVSVSAPLPAALNLIGFKISSSAGDAIANFSPGTVTVNNVNFGVVSNVHMHATITGAQVAWIGPYCISGGALAHYQSTNGGAVAGANPVTLTGTPAFTTFAQAFGPSTVFVPGVTFSGSATGQRYLSTGNGFIFTNGCAPNFFPGNSAGTTGSGGQCL